jgi:streptomycin 3"-adenylyltransferase
LTALLDPIPGADLRRAMTDELEPLLGDLDADTRNIILTLARIWATVETGEIHPKDVAADWVFERLPPEHRPVVERARAIYLGDERERWEDLRDRVHPAADELLRHIRDA